MLSFGPLLFWAIFGLACGAEEEEAPTAERLLAEKLGTLVEAQEGEVAPVREEELKLWEAKFRTWKEESEPEVYEAFAACLEKATVFEAAMDCTKEIDPQESVDPVDKPQTVDQICTAQRKLAVEERREHEIKMTMEYCRTDMLRLKIAVAANWTSFGRCVMEAIDTLEVDSCQYDALPRAEEHCDAIGAILRKFDEPISEDHAVICASRIETRRASLNRLENRIDLSCCLNLALSPDDIKTCMESNSPRCKPK